MMREQVFASFNQGGLHDIDLPKYCSLGLGACIWDLTLGDKVQYCKLKILTFI